MEITLVQDMEKQYLAIRMEEKITFGYQQKMVMHNRISGLLRVELRSIDQDESFFYDVTSLYSIKDIYQYTKLKLVDLKFCFNNIIHIIQQAKEYLLQENNFLLHPETVYSDRKSIFLCYLEGYEVTIKDQLLELAEFFMQRVDYQDEKAVVLIYGIYKELREEQCSFDKLIEMLNHFTNTELFSKEEQESVKRENVERTSEHVSFLYNSEEAKREVIPDRVVDPQPKYLILGLIAICNIIIVLILCSMDVITKPITHEIDLLKLTGTIVGLAGFDVIGWKALRDRIHVEDKSIFHDIEELDEEECNQTTVLARRTISCILSPKNKIYSDIIINQYPYIIGKESGISGDYISKRHATIEYAENQLLIKDLNSTNGTFLNGTLLESNISFPIMDGDSLIFAEDEYTVHINS